MSDVIQCPFLQQASSQATKETTLSTQASAPCPGKDSNPVDFPYAMYWVLPILKMAMDSDLDLADKDDIMEHYNDIRDELLQISYALTACEADVMLIRLQSRIDSELSEYTRDPETGLISFEGDIHEKYAIEFAFFSAARDRIVEFLQRKDEYE
jgi:hypothetical protein